MKKAQVWIETVIYTAIGIAVIGILLAVSKPKIDSMRDNLVIEQTIESLNNIHDKIYEIQSAPGNRRSVELKISKGRLSIDSVKDRLIWVIDSKSKYSEPDLEIAIGNQMIKTTEGEPNRVELWEDYGAIFNITFSGSEELKEIDYAPSPYFLYIENKGIGAGGRQVVDIVLK
jgi:hypothetical protein